MEYLIVFVFGVIIGSFLNVCIFRLPLGKSIVMPRSFCPFCEKPIKWYDNVPLVSFMVLGGKCRNCSRPIPIRYFFVELFTALAGIVLLYNFSFTAPFFIYWFFTCALIVVLCIDIEHQEIPDVISLPGIFIGAALMTVFRLDGSSSHYSALVNSLLGILAGGGSMFLMGVVGELIYKRQAVGGGDVKLMGMIGAILGWKLVLLSFFLAPLFGAGVGLFMKIKFHKDVIAYGPYLSLAAIVSMLFGSRILDYIFRF